MHVHLIDGLSKSFNCFTYVIKYFWTCQVQLIVENYIDTKTLIEITVKPVMMWFRDIYYNLWIAFSWTDLYSNGL